MDANSKSLPTSDDALTLLRKLWEAEPRVFWSLTKLAERLNCEVSHLYDADFETGILWELRMEGLIYLNPTSACAMGATIEWQ